MNHFAEFTDFKASLKLQAICGIHHQGVAIMVVKAVDLLRPNAERPPERPRKSIQIAKIMLIDYARPIRGKQGASVLNEFVQALPGFFAKQVCHGKHD
ncbi:hypothetical protein D1872_293300 [compost metagenome]